jgi:hypothetical protein
MSVTLKILDFACSQTSQELVSKLAAVVASPAMFMRSLHFSEKHALYFCGVLVGILNGCKLFIKKVYAVGAI